MAKQGFVAYHKYLKTLEPLSDAEVGRLFRACLQYSMTGEEPDLRGNERMLFPTVRDDIDRETAEYKQKCERQRENVKKRWEKQYHGIPTDTNVYHGIPTDTNDTYRRRIRIRNINNTPYNPPVGDVEKKGSKRFVKPTEDEVAAYCKERGNTIDAAAFVAFYDSNGWRVGKNPMKDWKAAVRTWEQKRKKESPPSQPKKEEHKLFKITDLSPEMRAKVELPPLW